MSPSFDLPGKALKLMLRTAVNPRRETKTNKTLLDLMMTNIMELKIKRSTRLRFKNKSRKLCFSFHRPTIYHRDGDGNCVSIDNWESSSEFVLRASVRLRIEDVIS